MLRRLTTSLLAWALLAQAPAMAAMGGDLPSFERFLHHVPHSTWKVVPDSADAGKLYAGRIGPLATILRVYLDGGRVTRQKAEVALPTDTDDEYALAILTRFTSEYARHPDELKPVMNTLRVMRKTILASGRRSTQMPYRDAMITLSLDSSTTEFSSKTIEVPWGMLFWKVEVVSNHPKKRRS